MFQFLARSFAIRLLGGLLGALALGVHAGAAEPPAAPSPEASAPARRVFIPTDWRAGEQARYRLIKTQERTAKGVPSKFQTQWLLTIDVLSVDGDRAVHRWRMQLDDGNLASLARESAPVRQAIGSVEELSMEMDVDSEGVVRSLRNLAQLRELLTGSIDQVLPAPGAEASGPSRASLRQAVTGMLGDDAFLSEQMLQDPRTFYSAGGGSYLPGMVHEGRQRHASALLPEGIETTVSSQVSPLGPDGALTVRSVELVPATTASKGVTELMDRMLKSGDPAAAEKVRQTIASMRLELRVESEFILVDGQRWPRLMRRSKRAAAEGVLRIESTELRLLDVTPPR